MLISNLPKILRKAKNQKYEDKYNMGKDTVQEIVDLVVEKDLKQFLTENKTVYVDAANGNDVTGDGTQESPWATIQKAVDECPTVMSRNYTYNIFVADGTYNENVVLHSKPRVNFVFSDSENGLILNGSIALTLGTRLGINGNITINIPENITRGLYAVNNGFLYFASSSKVKIVGKQNAYGIYISDSSDLIIYSDNMNKISNVNSAVLVGDNSKAFINGLEIDPSCNIGLNSWAGDIKYSPSRLINNAANKFSTIHGGHIEFCPQGWQFIGSINGTNKMKIDRNLYTEFLLVGIVDTASRTWSVVRGDFNSAALGAYYSNKQTASYSIELSTTGNELRICEASRGNTTLVSYDNIATSESNRVTVTVYGKR